MRLIEWAYTCTLSFVFQTTHVQFTDWFRRYGALTAFVALDVLVSTNTNSHRTSTCIHQSVTCQNTAWTSATGEDKRKRGKGWRVVHYNSTAVKFVNSSLVVFLKIIEYLQSIGPCQPLGMEITWVRGWQSRGGSTPNISITVNSHPVWGERG